MNNVDFLENADNVYRTKRYIVKQEIDLEVDSLYDNMMVSHDTYYLRTAARDAKYDNVFRGKVNLNGKRVATGMSTRRYVF